MESGRTTASSESREAFDRVHLDHYTMQNQELAMEVVGLFLAQLPVTLDMIEAATAADDWRFASHALKGSAAAVGAWKLHYLAASLEKLAFPGDDGIRHLRIQALKAAAAEFRDLARRAYPHLS